MTDFKFNNSDVYLTKGPVPVLRSHSFDQVACGFFNYGFSTRLGGVSEGKFASMSLGLKLGDDREKVLENYRRFCHAAGVSSLENVSGPDQVHKTNIRLATREDRGGAILHPARNNEIDAQITKEPEVALVVHWADCVPILLADPVGRVVGSIHAGWRGTVGGIAKKTVEEMAKAYATNPKNLHALIGPSAGPDNYEVDDKTIAEFDKVLKREQFMGTRAPRDSHHGYVDLWKANKNFLIQAGVPEENIVVTEVCTIDYNDLFHSHRATGGERGVNAGIIEITT